MNRILSFSLGYLTEEINSFEIKNFLALLKKLKIQGIEITFATKERLSSFKLDNNLIRKLREFQHITIHAPFELLKDSKNEEEIIEQLDIIAKIYSEIKAKNVIIHPDNLPRPRILQKYNFNISTENLKKKRRITILKLRKIFKKYPKMGFCVDTSHAYSWSKYETEKLIKNFKNRITQIHLSCRYKNKDHQPLRKASEEFLSSIKPIKKLDVPIIIEEEMKMANFKSIKEEIEYIKKFLNLC